jgi:hypothetical protein
LAKLGHATADRGQFGRSDQGEIARVEDEDQPAVNKVFQPYSSRATGSFDTREIEAWGHAPYDCNVMSHVLTSHDLSSEEGNRSGSLRGAFP